MRHVISMLVLCISIALIAAPAFSEQSITLFNEIDKQTGHDNHMVAVQMFGDRSEITYCDGTEIENLLPLIRELQSDSRQPITLRSVAVHEFDLNNRGWVVIGVCNRIKDSDPSIWCIRRTMSPNRWRCRWAVRLNPCAKCRLFIDPEMSLLPSSRRRDRSESHSQTPQPSNNNRVNRSGESGGI